jgi:hypothetical protein
MVSAYNHKEVLIMTKLFSMKSLAFAGAAAFALTLAAAPQADAAQMTASVDYSKGILTVENATLTSSGDDDSGLVVYYQTNKDATKFATKKYTAVTATSNKEIDISNLMGKATYIALSTDGKDVPGTVENATTVAIVASPTIKKATFEASTSSITITEKTAGELGNIATNLSGYGYTAQIRRGTYGAWTTATETEIKTAVQQAKAIGSTLNIRIASVSGGTQTSPWSKEAKVKISAQAKAPKVALDLAATKAFTAKFTDKQEYKIQVGSSGTPTAWKTGDKTAKSWSALFEDAGASTSVVSGDAITSDVKLYVRTKADSKKIASATTIIDLKASASAPTSGAVKVEVTAATVDTTKNKIKKATTAAIVATKAEDGGKDIQYSTDGGEKWNKLAAGATKALKSTNTSILVRFPGDKTNYVLPSRNASITVDFETGNATDSTELSY